MDEFETKKELLQYAEQAEGLTFGQVDKTSRLSNRKMKGSLGQIIEESYFGYEINSNQEADFEDLGVELKVTPIRELKNGLISAKERLVLNIINYEKEYLNTFETSSFWTKNEELLIMFYLWRKEWERSEYPIVKSMLHTYPEEDLLIIKQDWEIIINKIKDGKAHELSEGDTNYLGAVTKGSSSKSVRKQPFNIIDAKQRAYSLKQSYMTVLARESITQDDLLSATSKKIDHKKLEKQYAVIKNVDILKKQTLDDYVISLFLEFNNWTRDDLVEHFSIVNKEGKRPKHVNYLITQKILGVGGNTKEVHAKEFEKANIVVKTIELNNGKSPVESLKVCEILDFDELTETSWDDSALKQKLETTKFLFIVFDKKTDGSVVLKGSKFWSMPVTTLDEIVRIVWEEEKEKLENGVKLTYKASSNKNGYIISNNLVKLADDRVVHIRPSAAQSQYQPPYRNEKGKLMNNARKLPKPAQWFNRPERLKEELQNDWMTKQAFWLNSAYLYSQL